MDERDKFLVEKSFLNKYFENAFIKNPLRASIRNLEKNTNRCICAANHSERGVFREKDISSSKYCYLTFQFCSKDQAFGPFKIFPRKKSSFYSIFDYSSDHFNQ